VDTILAVLPLVLAPHNNLVAMAVLEAAVVGRAVRLQVQPVATAVVMPGVAGVVQLLIYPDTAETAAQEPVVEALAVRTAMDTRVLVVTAK
jgi:hypothetical protein|tara:strand:- start:332 stop:604 length:273 start_codon:yes stop_codon:yes gene_type:complete